MPTIQISVNVPEMTEDEIRDAIIVKATEFVLGTETSTNYDDDGEVIRKVQDLAGYRRAIEAATVKTIEEEVKRTVPPLVQEVISSPFIPTNRWGERVGAAKTIRDIVVEAAQAYLTEKVRAYDGSRDPHGSDSIERLRFFIRKDVEETWKKIIGGEVEKISAMIRDEYAARIKARVAEIISDAVGAKR